MIMQVLNALLSGYKYQCNKYKVIADLWMCGPAEKDSNGNKFDGAYPAGFLKNFYLAFSDYIPSDKKKILHVCAGRVPKSEGVTLDINPNYNPDYLCNAETMRYGSLDGEMQVPSNSFALVLADPPYNEEASKKYYNIKLLSKSKMLKQMARVVVKSGLVGILDQTMPVSPPKELKCVARIGVTSVPNLDMRILTIFQKV